MQLLNAAVWVEIAAGNPYNFPLYSPALKSVLGYNQQQLTILGVANDFGENVSILPGIMCNKLPPWAVLSIGVCACFLGYGVLWLAVSQTVQSVPYWVVKDNSMDNMNDNHTNNHEIVTFLLYASALNGTLYVATGLLGICYGVQFAIMIPTASELFGLKHFGIIFNFMQLGNPIGALLFSALLAGCVRYRGSQARRVLLFRSQLLDSHSLF